MRTAAPAVSSMLGVTTMTSMSVFTVAVFAPAAAKDIGVEATTIGAFTSIVYLIAMGSGLVSSAMTDRYGAIRVCQATMLFAALGMAAFTIATPWAAVLAAVLLGMGYGPVNPVSAQVLMGVSTPRWRPLMFSIKQTGVTLGGLLAGALVPWLVVEMGWRAAALAVGAGAVLLLVAMQPLRQAFDGDRRAVAAPPGLGMAALVRLAFAHRALRRLAAVGFAYAGCQVSVGAFFVVYMTEALGFPLLEAGAVFAVMQGGGIFGRLFWGAVSDRVAPARWVLAGLGLLMAACVIGLTAATADWPFWALAALGAGVGLSNFGWNGVYLAEVARLAPDGRVAEATGSVQFIMYGGVMAVPPLFGAGVVLLGGYTAPFLAVAGLAAAAGLYMTGTDTEPA